MGLKSEHIGPIVNLHTKFQLLGPISVVGREMCEEQTQKIRQTYQKTIFLSVRGCNKGG